MIYDDIEYPLVETDIILNISRMVISRGRVFGDNISPYLDRIRKYIKWSSMEANICGDNILVTSTISDFYIVVGEDEYFYIVSNEMIRDNVKGFICDGFEGLLQFLKIQHRSESKFLDKNFSK